MEKIRKAKVSQMVDKLAVSSEPGLTNAQLMLTNHDLKPGTSLMFQLMTPWLMTLQWSRSVVNGVRGTSSASGLRIHSTS